MHHWHSLALLVVNMIKLAVLEDLVDDIAVLDEGLHLAELFVLGQRLLFLLFMLSWSTSSFLRHEF